MDTIWKIIGTIIILILFSVLRYIFNYLRFANTKRNALKTTKIKPKKNDEKLNRRIDFVYNEFLKRGLNIGKEYKISSEIWNLVVDSNYSQESLQTLTNDIINHTGVNSKIKIYVHEKRNSIDNIAGFYRINDIGDKEIHIYRDTKLYMNNVISVISHECAHNFMYHYQMNIEDKGENEIITDIVTVFLGFGAYLLDGYKDIKWIDNEEISSNGFKINSKSLRIGYISSNDVAYIMRYISKLKEQDELNQRINKKRNLEELRSQLNVTIELYNSNENLIKQIIENSKSNTLKDIPQEYLKIIMKNCNMYFSDELKMKVKILESQLNEFTNSPENISPDFNNKIFKLNKEITELNTIVSKYI